MRPSSGPSAASADARAFFDAIAGRYDRVYAPPRGDAAVRMARVLRSLPPKARLLDLGVGTGRELSALLDAGHSVIACDFSAEMLARCARRTRPVSLVRADFWRPLPFEEGRFDAVLALHGTLAHPPSRAAASALGQEVARLLAPGGLFVIEVPGKAWFERGGAALVRTGEETGTYTDDATGKSIEVRLFDVRSWTEILDPRMDLVQATDEAGELFLVARPRARGSRMDDRR